MNELRTATLKLTAWYLAILITVCLAFSVALYRISSQEFDRPLPPSGIRYQSGDIDQTYQALRQARAEESKRNILVNLTMLNLVTLTIGAGASYLFAKRTLRPIEEALESQARFTSDASHELRTPLAVMRTENEIALREKKLTVASLATTLKSNLEEVARLQQLTDRLLALSSNQSLTLEPFSVTDVVSEVLSRQQHIANQNGIVLVTKGKPPKYRALGSIDATCDIVSILVDNAVKYSPKKSQVTIEVRVKNSTVEIAVCDEGPGISNADKERIFDRFYRADQSRSKQHVEGHGLGLALAKRLADLSNASITIENGKVKGAIFTLSLPKASKA